MTCREFLDLWNARLDGSEAPSLADLERHSAGCEACRARGQGFAAIAQGLPKLATLAPPPGFADRVVLALAAPEPRTIRFPRPWAASIVGLAAAASIALVFVRPRPAPAPILAAPPPRSLALAFSDATTATLDLAREASAPAARIGHDLLGSASPSALPSPAIGRLDPSGAIEPTGMVETIGRKVEAGVGPLTGSARSAFGFLSLPKPPARPATTGRDGA